MKISELSKTELIELLTLLCECNKGQFRFEHPINNFLRKRWEDKNRELMKQQDEVDIFKDFPKWEALGKKIEKLNSYEVVEYYCTLDELK